MWQRPASAVTTDVKLELASTCHCKVQQGWAGWVLHKDQAELCLEIAGQRQDLTSRLQRHQAKSTSKHIQTSQTRRRFHETEGYTGTRGCWDLLSHLEAWGILGHVPFVHIFPSWVGTSTRNKGHTALALNGSLRSGNVWGILSGSTSTNEHITFLPEWCNLPKAQPSLLWMSIAEGAPGWNRIHACCKNLAAGHLRSAGFPCGLWNAGQNGRSLAMSGFFWAQPWEAKDTPSPIKSNESS